MKSLFSVRNSLIIAGVLFSGFCLPSDAGRKADGTYEAKLEERLDSQGMDEYDDAINEAELIWQQISEGTFESASPLSLRDKIIKKYGDGSSTMREYEAHRAFYDAHPQTFNPVYFGIDDGRGTLFTGNILPPEHLTPSFFRQLEHFVTTGNYEAAVVSFLSADDIVKAAWEDGKSYEAILAVRLGLVNFLGYEIINMNCNCPLTDYSTAELVLESIVSIEVQEGKNSALGFIEVRFKNDMRFVDRSALKKDTPVEPQLLKAYEPYKTQFTQHWDVYPVTEHL